MDGLGMAGQVAGMAVFAVALLDACVSDIRAFRIANRDALAIIVALAVSGIAAGMDVTGVLVHAGAGAAMFAAGFMLYLIGGWGGGDVKLTAAVALMTGLADLPRFVVVMTLAGGALAVLALVARRLPLAKDGPVKLWGERLASSGHVPYGVAIAAGGFDWMATSWLSRLAG